jgi:hypothetical protein
MKEINLEDLDPKVEPITEKLHRLARGSIGAIPIIGSISLEVFNSVLEAPLSKRRTEIIEQIGTAINELTSRGVITEQGLQDNEVFISTVAEACSIALRNHQYEKLEALRNAVLNSALPGCPNEDYRRTFLNFVDTCTVTHIRLLKLFENPAAWLSSNNRPPLYGNTVSLSQIVASPMPELFDTPELLDTIWADLYARGLVEIKQLEMILSLDSCSNKQTTSFGSKLIAFLSKPDTLEPVV